MRTHSDTTCNSATFMKHLSKSYTGCCLSLEWTIHDSSRLLVFHLYVHSSKTENLEKTKTTVYSLFNDVYSYFLDRNIQTDGRNGLTHTLKKTDIKPIKFKAVQTNSPLHWSILELDYFLKYFRMWWYLKIQVRGINSSFLGYTRFIC